LTFIISLFFIKQPLIIPQILLVRLILQDTSQINSQNENNIFKTVNIAFAGISAIILKIKQYQQDRRLKQYFMHAGLTFANKH